MFSDSLKARLHLIPVGKRPETQHAALCLKFAAENCPKLGRWEHSIAFRKAHAWRRHVALRKMMRADPVVVGLDGRVFIGPEHSQDFRALSQAEQVVVIDMPAVTCGESMRSVESQRYYSAQLSRFATRDTIS